MAEVSAFQQPRRRKPVTYGKISRKPTTWSLDALKDDDELQVPAPKPVVERTRPVKETYAVTKPETTETHTLKPIKRREKTEDAWDVPTSGDEDELPAKRKMPPKLLAGRRHVVEHVPKKHEQEQLAPWERRTEESQSELDERRRRKKHQPLTSDTQLMSELTYSLQEGQSDKATRNVPKVDQRNEQNGPMTASPARVSSPATSSAAARLQARRQLNTRAATMSADEASKSKRSGQDVDTAMLSSRKRLKSEMSPGDASDDLVMLDAPEELACEHPQVVVNPSTNDADVYDLPDSSADESTERKPKAAARKLPSKPRRGKLVSRSSPRKMESAPARLGDMLSNELDSTDETSPSAAANSPPATPPKSIISSRAATPETAFRHGGTMTPKQVKLWDNLLDDSSSTTPGVLGIKDLTLNTRRVVKTTNMAQGFLAKSSSDLGPRRRTKLVDRLKASAPTSDADTSYESDDETTDADVEMGDDEQPAPMEAIAPQASQSQSQTQSTNAAGSGPKVTYASRTRSHLPEDSFENGLMFSLGPELPQPKATTFRQPSNKSNAASQKSAFDMDGSEDDEQAGRVQTIHELRASGVNRRFMDDIGGLLGDIADHNVSARSRRRSALIELASKLADTGFAEKFLRQGYEQQLIAEIDAARDQIADFAMAAAVATILCHELPDHVAPSLKDGGILTWLNDLLQMRVDAVKMVKDRKNNMAKSAQKSFAEFVTALKDCDLIWGETKPGLVTPRTIALKVLDKLVSKLRKSGDRSELVKTTDLGHIVPENDELPADAELPIDCTLSISTLEALSTTALSLAWPSDVVDRLRTILVDPRISDGKSQHLLFLTLRLCLNLTNENARNCKILSKPPTVTFLLQAMNDGFANLHADVADEQRTINLDLLVLSTGILINLTEHHDGARQQATTTIETRTLLTSLVDVFRAGQQRLIEAESVEQSATNVAYGYLAVVLANLCRNAPARALVASKLPGGKLSALVEGLAEFVLQHQTVDITLEGEEGMEVWRAFTEKLKEVLRRLRVEADRER